MWGESSVEADCISWTQVQSQMCAGSFHRLVNQVPSYFGSQDVMAFCNTELSCQQPKTHSLYMVFKANIVLEKIIEMVWSN